MDKNYDQLAQKDTFYSCSVYAALNNFKNDLVGVHLEIGIILKAIMYFAKAGKLILTEGAVADIIFPAICLYIRFYLGLNFKVEKGNIDTIEFDKGYILGFKKANLFYKTIAKDGEITREEIEKLAGSKGGTGHFHFYKKGTIKETLGGFDYKITKENISYAYSKGLYYYPTRKFVPVGDKTIEICEKSMNLVRKRKNLRFKNYFLSLDQFKCLFLNNGK